MSFWVDILLVNTVDTLLTMLGLSKAVCSHVAMRMMDVRPLRVRGSASLYTDSRCVYLCNHQVVCDGIIDDFATGGRAAFVMRYLSLLVAPGNVIRAFCTRSVCAIRRGRGGAYAQIVAFFKRTSIPGIIIYPEGTRRGGETTVGPLRTGGMRLAHELGVPVQIIITFNKHRILSVRTLSSEHGVSTRTLYGVPLDPLAYESYEAFECAVTQQWKSVWQRALDATDDRDLEPMPHPVHYQPLVEYHGWRKWFGITFGIAVLWFLWTCVTILPMMLLGYTASRIFPLAL